MTKFRSGNLDRQIIITQQSETVSPSGGVAKSWTPVHTARAEKVELASTESLEAFGNADSGEVVFRIRYIADLSTQYRISFEGADYDIESISELGRRHGQEIRGVLVQ